MEKSLCSVEVTLPCSYLLDKKQDAPFLAVVLHGYGQTAEMLAAYSRRLLGPAPSVAAIQAPHPQYLEALPSARVGYNWGTSADWPGAIRLHHEILMKVLAQLPALPVLLIGFSQPVGLNYRFLAAHPGRVQATLALCGGVPKEWTPPAIISTPILHIARSEDEFFPLETAARFEQRLREVAADVEFQLIPGKHRFPSDGRRLIQPWIRRIFHHDVGEVVPEVHT
jgi:predicted esterase